MKRLIISALIFILFAPFKSGAEDIIIKNELLSLERCIELALKKHPEIAAAAGTASASRSRFEQARASYYPQIDLTAGYSRIAPIYTNRSSSTASVLYAGSYGASYDQYSGSVALTQNVFDFGKTASQVKVQQLTLNSAVSDLENVTDKIIFNVKQAYYGVLQAKRNRNVSADAVKQFQQHLEQARGFYSAGTKPKFDVTKAEMDLSNSKLNLIKSENVLRLAVVNLNNSLGIPDAPEYIIEDNLSFKRYEVPFEDAIAKAYKNRPDLKSAIATRQAAESSVEVAKKDFYPSLTGTAAYNWAGSSFPLDNGWNVGATLSLPIFSGFLTKNQVEEAKANLSTLMANETALRQTIFLEVQQAFLNLNEADERIPASELTVKYAQENYDIAGGRYAAGVGNPIEVTDAEVALLNARMAYIQALSDYKIAQASLWKAMGIRQAR